MEGGRPDSDRSWRAWVAVLTGAATAGAGLLYLSTGRTVGGVPVDAVQGVSTVDRIITDQLATIIGVRRCSWWRT